MKKNLLYLLLISLLAVTLPVMADEEFDDEDVQFDEEGNALVEEADESEEADEQDEAPAAEEVTETAAEEVKTEPADAAKEGAAPSDTEAEKAAGPQFAPPKFSDYMSRLNAKAGSDRGAKSYCSKIGVTSEADVQKTYNLFRQNDIKLKKQGESNHSTRLASSMKGQKKVVAESSRFKAVYPEKCKAVKGGKAVEVDTAEFYGIDKILAAGDSAFDKATEALVMTDFINWAGKFKGTVFFVTKSEDWTMLKGTGLRNSPVQTIYNAKGYREFYVFLTPVNKDWNAEAFAYTVAAAVLDEFLSVVNPRGSVNEFLTIGFAAYCSDLSSVVTEGGPSQVSRFQGKPVTYDMLLKVKSGSLPFKALPLEKSGLIGIDAFVKNGPPTDNAKLYYYLRQASALYDYLSIKDALPLVYLMRRSKEQNRNFDKDYDNFFASLHRDSFMGKKSDDKKDKDKDKDKKDKKDKDKDKDKDKPKESEDSDAESSDIGNNFKTFRNRVPALVFYPLTTDSVASDIEEQKKAKKEKSPKGDGPAPKDSKKAK